VLRALVLVGRDRAAVSDAIARYRRHVAKHPHAVDPNLLDIVVAAAARQADGDRFEEMKELARTELDPAAKRRYLHALAMVEDPRLVPRSVELALDPFVPMQDFASYLGTLLANRAAREEAWRLLKTRWSDVRKKGDSPMILRRLVEALGNLNERRHLVEVEKFLAEHELPPARQAVAQTLERLRADVELRERLQPEVSELLKRPVANPPGDRSQA
jgi:puromycin-sensitive aminopeptidase